MSTITANELPLQRAYHWEKARGTNTFLTQPIGSSEGPSDVREWTWAQAMDEARRIATWLKAQGQAQGWESGARVALMSKNTAWWIMSDLAIWMAGYVTVPIYPNLVGESVAQILDHSEARLCIIGKLDDWPAMRAGIPADLPVLLTPFSQASDLAKGAHWDDVIAQSAPMIESPTYPEEAIATIIYTSGTTGTPKGAVHSFASFAHSGKVLTELIELTPEDRAFSYLPLAHVAERAIVECTALYAGQQVFFNDTLASFMADLQRARPSLFFSVPRLWAKFQQGIFAKMPPQKLDAMLSDPQHGETVRRQILQQLGLDSVRFAGTGSAPLAPDIMAWYRKLGLELLDGYGMTENFGLTNVTQPGKSRTGYIGPVLSHCEMKISEDGEVLSRGPAHMQGYFKDPEKTRETLTDDGWLRTGDMGQFDEEGRLRIIGRAKEQFKTSKGKYVAPAPIESRLAAFQRIEACMVAGASFAQPFALAMLPAGQWDALCAASEPSARAAFTAELTAHLELINEQLDPHERLDFIAVVPEQWTIDGGFLTPTLKLKRNVLEQHYAAWFERWLDAKTPVVWHDGHEAPT